MNWPTLVRHLVDSASGRAPTDEEVHAALLAAADDDEEREWFEGEEAGVAMLREEAYGSDGRSLLRFVWQPDSMLSSSLSVQWVAGDACGLLVERNDYDPESTS